MFDYLSQPDTRQWHGDGQVTAFLSERGDCGVSVITEEAREEGGERRTDRERNKDREQEDRNSNKTGRTDTLPDGF